MSLTVNKKGALKLSKETGALEKALSLHMNTE